MKSRVTNVLARGAGESRTANAGNRAVNRATASGFKLSPAVAG